MFEIKAVTYEEARREYLEEQMQKAQRKIKYWESRIDRSRPHNMRDPAAINAADCGWEYNFYKDALEALENNKFQYETGFVKGFEAARPKWISAISEHPEDHAVVLIYCNDGEVGAARFEEEYGCFVTTEKGTWKGAYGAVTHWMPMPSVPKEEA